MTVDKISSFHVISLTLFVYMQFAGAEVNVTSTTTGLFDDNVTTPIPLLETTQYGNNTTENTTLGNPDNMTTTAYQTTKAPIQNRTLLLFNMNFKSVASENKKNTNGIIAKISDISIARCSERCIRKANCDSFNFRVKDMTCELIKPGTPSHVDDEDWVYFGSLDWAKNTTEHCDKNTCTGISKCVDITGGGTDCIITHCDSPPAIIGATLSSDNYFDYEVGKSVSYKCEATAQQAGNPTITCQQDGTWTATSFECRCNEPPAVTGVYLKSERVVGTTLTYTCTSPLTTIGNTKSLTCGSNGYWSPSSTDVYCVCPGNPVLRSGTRWTSTPGRRIGQTWTLACIYNYVEGCTYCRPVNGIYYTTCQSNGYWTAMNYYCY